MSINSTIFLAYIFSHLAGVFTRPINYDESTASIVQNTKLKVINAAGFKDFYDMASTYPGTISDDIITIYHYNNSPRFLNLELRTEIINGNDWIYMIQPTIDEIRRVEGYQYPKYNKYLWFCSDWKENLEQNVSRIWF